MKDIERMVRMTPELRYDPIVKQELKRVQRRYLQRSIHLMLQRPACSGWIALLQNNVNLNSVGNQRFATKVYYDARTQKVGDSPETCDTPFRMARLKNRQHAAGWTEA